MQYLKNKLLKLISVLLTLIVSTHSFAHVMVAQHGTLNIVDDGVFMVLSLPVSAFEGIDDDQDSKLSSAEFSLHRTAIAKTVKESILLQDKTGKLDLQGMMLSPVTPHHSPKEPAAQLIVMGRFALADVNSELQYQVKLFGKSPTEQVLEITATNKAEKKKHAFSLTAKESNVQLFRQELVK